MESLELFGSEVLPEFADRDEAPAREPRRDDSSRSSTPPWPASRPSDHPPLPSPDYAFPAIPRALADRSGSDDFHRWLDELAEKTATGEQPEEFRQLLDLTRPWDGPPGRPGGPGLTGP